MIEPTVSRMVWFRPDDSADPDNGERLSGQIARVNQDGTVNLCILDPAGIPFNRICIRLRQDGETVGPGECEWMPYQKGQAARTEQLERAPGVGHGG